MAKQSQRVTRQPQAERKARITPKVREAIRLMVEEGRKRPEAAAAVGMQDDSLYRALRRPECLALRTSLLGSLREAESSRSIARVANLADTAASEHVRLGANELLLGLNGEGPVIRGSVTHHHQGLAPGLVVNFIAPPDAAPALPAGPPVIDATPRLPGLPERVPHPSELRGKDGRSW